ncbi:hypothetical protein RFI_12061 [Reticulomyxa filosa]|uniref:Sulfatase N-terminal domain-containing protein n=1 Tax=Reticulomyxa filosa TaxID=46433 RepID=X6NGF6_RETFI|nr:hypothetical protein RFI_12061 [Reticulomyxa filosa]|eukprot:ETO25081.1 hypothetical protein RFI_12061 [Reticulomyxa filosa]
MIGQLLKYLQDNGMGENTLVIFISDNGGALSVEGAGNNGHLKCGKGTTWEGGPRVPAILWWPNRVPAGRVTRQLGSTLDVLPTIADLLQLSLPTDRVYDGVSQVGWFFNNPWLLFVKINGRYPFFYTDFFFKKKEFEVLHWSVKGGVCSTNYADPDCRSNNSAVLLQSPYLYNLYHDPSEHVKLNISLPFYANIVARLNETFKSILTPGLWSPSQIQNTNTTYEPCCAWGYYFILFYL